MFYNGVFSVNSWSLGARWNVALTPLKSKKVLKDIKSVLKKFAARFQALVEHVFDDQAHHDLTQMKKDMDQMIFGVYDLTECVQESLIVILIQSLVFLTILNIHMWQFVKWVLISATSQVGPLIFETNMSTYVKVTINDEKQAMWLIVTSEPENKFGKKAILDKMPWKLLIDSMQLSLRNIVKSQVSASGTARAFFWLF